MTSTSVTTAGGVMVVTQIIPKDESSERTRPPTVPLAPPPAAKTPPPSPVKMDDMTVMFLRGCPTDLGVVQIFIGVMCLLFSLTACCSWRLILFSLFAFGVTFVVSGSVAVAAGRCTSIRRIWATLVSHVVSIWVSLAGVAFVCWLLPNVTHIICDYNDFLGFSNLVEVMEKCMENQRLLYVVLYGLEGLLLVLLVLQLYISISICVFSGRAARLRSRYTPILTDDHRSLMGAPGSP